jgi:LuxR family maltose regulon positive regulatory protein
MAGALTLVAAPPGSGKTTLLADWLRRQGRPVAWVALDEGDNDPVRFWAYAIAALDAACPGVGAEALAMLGTTQPGAPERALAVLINALAACGDEFILALDDYHVIASLPIHRTLLFLLEHRPANLRVVVASRADPPLPLTRLRARGELAEVRAADLRFTPEEAADFLERAMGLRLRSEVIAALDARTEGWIAGLQLAALAVRGGDDPARLVAAASGGHRHILDYLVEEVLERQPDDRRAFLLDTAILDRLDGPLCDAVTGREDSQATLEALEHDNLFLVPLDDERRWYRYHHLFADALRARLRQLHPDRARELHRRAADWHAAQGTAAEAIRHAKAAGDAVRAAELIERVAPAAMARGEWGTLLGWCADLPPAVAADRPRLSIAHAAALLYTGQADAAAQLAAAERALAHNTGALAPDEHRLVAGKLAAMRALRAYLREEADEAIAQARRALGDLPPGHHLRPQTLLALAASSWLAGDVASAEAQLLETRRAAEAAGNAYLAQVATAYQAQVCLLAGRRREAAALHRENLRAATAHGVGLHANGPLVGLGTALHEEGDLAGAERHLRQGLDLGRREGNRLVIVGGSLALARTLHARGDADGARALLEEAGALAREHGLTWTWVGVTVAAQLVRGWLALGETAEAERWAAAATATERPSRPATLAEADAIATTRLHLVAGRADQALDAVARLLPGAERAGRLGHALELHVLQALALHAAGHTARAVAALEPALALAAPEGYSRLFLDEGPALADLLARALAAPARGDSTPLDAPVREYARGLLAAWNGTSVRATAPAARPDVAAQPLAEPLSERELEVLRLLARGASNQALAEALFVSTNTVKKHLGNIFGKLDAANRTAAVARARELGLL